MSEKLDLRICRELVDRLAYTSGLALGLASQDQWDKIVKIVEDNKAFWNAVNLLFLKMESNDERKEK